MEAVGQEGEAAGRANRGRVSSSWTLLRYSYKQNKLRTVVNHTAPSEYTERDYRKWTRRFLEVPVRESSSGSVGKHKRRCSP